MSHNFSYYIDDESGKLVERFEKYLSGTAPGYFDVDEMERIVEYYLAFGRTTDSLHAVELGKRLHPASSSLDMKRAQVYLATGNTQKALRILSNLVESSDYEITLLKIEAFQKLGRTEEAYHLAMELIADEEEEDLDELCIDMAMTFMSIQEFTYALEILKSGEKSNPYNVDLLLDMAFCLEQKGELAESAEMYKRIVAIDAYISEAWFNLGQVNFLLGQYEEALEAFDYVLVINEKDDIASMQKAHTHFQLGHWQQAIDIYLECAQTAPETWQIWLFIGECYEKTDNYSEAMRYYKRSYSEMENNYEALIGISICLLEMEKFQESLEYIHKALEISDEMADAWVFLAEAKVGLGENQSALEAYQQAISFEPNQPDVLLSMANIYMDEAEFQTALTYYELAYSFDPTLEFIELFIAVASYYTENYEKSGEFLDLAVHRNLDAANLFLDFCPDAAVQRFEAPSPAISNTK